MDIYSLLTFTTAWERLGLPPLQGVVDVIQTWCVVCW